MSDDIEAKINKLLTDPDFLELVNFQNRPNLFSAMCTADAEQLSINAARRWLQQLYTSEQLWLIERLVHHVHEATLKQSNGVDEELALMATDPQIQDELRRIEQEFSCADANGLETT